MAIEEYAGYMDYILEESPQYSEKVAALRKEHDDCRDAIAEIITKLDRLVPTDKVSLQTIRQDVLELYRKYSDHSSRETALMQGAMLTDYGAAD